VSIAYYGEHDPYAAHWLRNLIAAGQIAPGVVDERDIRDVRPEELIGFTQVHMFAGIGIWSHALRRAGFSDDRPIWTGSCPCQPFSAAGRAGGFTDERHLWPHWHWLISQCRPPIVLGEQVASKDGLGWLDLVSTDMEGAGYAFGATDLCAAGIGVEWQESQSGEWLRRAIHDCVDPVVRSMLCDFADWAGAGNIDEGGNHIRQRLYFVGLADDYRGGRGEYREPDGQSKIGRAVQQRRDDDGCGDLERLADTMSARRPERGTRAGGGRTAGLRAAGRMENPQLSAQSRQRPVGGPGLSEQETAGFAGGCLADRLELSGRSDSGLLREQAVVGLADDFGKQRSERTARSDDAGRRNEKPATLAGLCSDIGTDATDGRRYAKDWLFCRDGKWRATRSGSFPLAHGASARVGRLRAYGNALDAETATRFCETVKELIDG
jgi:DNA (cytosine-5)-methyltransferase 1